MFDAILAALPLVFTWPVLLGMVGGTALGIAVGALPGLSATMAIAVLIPLTFSMDTLVALGMVAGIYNGAMYGGAIPSILLRIPGTPSAIATVFDGYPMARQGKAQLALDISLTSSAFGSIVGAIVLICFAPPLATFALRFSPADYFWLAVFGMTAIAMLLGSNPIKGVLATLIGLAIGMVGIDTLTGTARYTFGVTELLSGVDLLVVLTGLFAIPPAIDLVAKSFSDAKALSVESEKSEFNIFSLWPTLLRSSGFGLIIGLLPALGGNVASLLAWHEERRSAKDNSLFGQGDPRGVAASECANNADNGTSLIPALTLGIPGNAVSAVILGVLLVHGLRPGPQLFRDNADLVFGFMISMLVSGGLMYVIGRLGSRVFINVIKLPPYILAPMIIGMTVVGVYSTNNSMFDVWLMLGFGLLGYVMDRLAIPAAPTVLALILGPMAEESLRRALLLSGNDFGYLVSSVISWIIIALIVLVIGVPIFRQFLKRSPTKREASNPP